MRGRELRYVCVGQMELVVAPEDARCPVAYLVDSVEHPLATQLDNLARNMAIVRIPVHDWNDALTPWPAAGLYRGEPDFGGNAATTLAELVDEAMPAAEEKWGLVPQGRAVCGYSLGGLFSVYAFVNGAFDACACLSGSLWYEGWTDYMHRASANLDGTFAYLSVGAKERRAARPILKGVQRNTEECVSVLEQLGCSVRYAVVPGGHFEHMGQRLAAGLDALAQFFDSTAADRARNER